MTVEDRPLVHDQLRRLQVSERRIDPDQLLPVSESKYYCAPQVFYFEPQKLWYLVYQVGMPGLKKMWVAYSTTTNITDPNSWTAAKPMLDGGEKDPRTVGGLDYWIICDDQRAYLFFTSLNGKMWRMWTKQGSRSSLAESSTLLAQMVPQP